MEMVEKFRAQSANRLRNSEESRQAESREAEGRRPGIAAAESPGGRVNLDSVPRQRNVTAMFGRRESSWLWDGGSRRSAGQVKSSDIHHRARALSGGHY